MTFVQRSGLRYIPAATMSNCCEFRPAISELNSVGNGSTSGTPSRGNIVRAMAGAEPVIFPSRPM